MFHRIAAAVAAVALVVPAAVAGKDKDAKDAPLAIGFKDASLKWGPCPDFIPKGCEIAVLHGDPEKKGADVFFKVPEDFDIPPHWHSSAEHMTLVSGELAVSYEGHPLITAKEGQYLFGPAKLAHSAHCNDGPCVLFIHFAKKLDAHPVEKDKEKDKAKAATRPR